MASPPNPLGPNGPSPLHFIENGPWKEALFTTYALSLTYFESYVLPRLREAGCEKVTLLVDIQGYRASMMELRARHVGKDYALIPVRVKDGIFHPKITYLRGEDQDLLMVGSGNLTFGGHGGNVEVLEVLSAGEQPGAFADFADFLENLCTRPHLQIADDSALLPFIQRARALSQQFHDQAPPQPVELLHSLDTAITEQLIERAAGRRWHSLLLLSPFHSRDGQSLGHLLKTLSIPRLTVGVPGNGVCSFPLEQTRDWPVEIDWVTPKVEHNQRRLHAKWLELRGAGSWTLTGSVNATRTSMDSTDNVEVAVLRKLDSATDECWEPVEAPRYEADAFERQDQEATLCVYARLNEEQQLEGRLIGQQALAGEWLAILECAEEVLETAPLQLTAQGGFVWPLQRTLDTRLDEGLQLRLERATQSARGWVCIDAYLSMPLPIRSLCGALGRLLGGNQAQGDLQILLNCLVLHAQQLPEEPDAPLRTEPATTPVNPPGGTEPPALQPPQRPRHWLPSVAKAATGRDGSWALLQAIAGLLHHANPGQGPVGHGDAAPIIELDDGREDGDFDPASDPNLESLPSPNLINEFNQTLQSLVNLKGLSSRKKAQLLYVWCHVALDFYLRRLHLPANARDFAQRWLNCVDHAQLAAEDRPLVDEAVYGLAATLALPGRLASSTTLGTLDATTLHEYLERYGQGPVDFVQARHLAQRWFNQEPAQRLVDHGVAEALEALDAVQHTSTLRALLSSYIEDRQQARQQRLPANRFTPEEITALQHIHSPNRPRPGYYRVNHRTISSCPNTRWCCAPVEREALARLTQRRISHCQYCQALMVSLEP